MNRQSFEVGMQRFYYVAWAALAVSVALSLYSEGKRDDEALMIWLGTCVVAPTVLMFVARWVYRGFMPK